MGTEAAQEINGEEIAARRITRRRTAASPSMGRSRLLSTMAVVVATADEGMDYLAFFLPFVADRLKTWPVGQPVEPHELSKALCEGWGFPSVPTAVSRLLLQRAEKDALVSSVERKFYVNQEKLLGMPDLAEKKQEMLAELNALAAAVVAYAHAVHGLDWNEETANGALERLTEDFGAELATAKREGGLAAGPELKDDEALAVVYGFARRAVDRDPENFNRLVAMVQGTMIANALYFEDIRKLPNRLPELRVYLDTAPLLRALGLASSAVVLAAQEMLALMRSFRIPMFVFSHTVDEMTAILERIAVSLNRGAGGHQEQGRLSGRSREAVDAAIQAGMSSGEVHTLIANIEGRLWDLGVRRCETPPHGEAGHIDEGALADVLSEVVTYPSRGPLEKDLDSLAAVDRLRGATRPRDLAHTRALFITANNAVSSASRTFFRSIGRDSPIPHCMSDVGLTAQLWVRSSNRKPDLPRRLLIADCYSALGPGPELWERWVSHIIKLRERNKLSDEQLQTLIYHQQTKALLFEVAHGKLENVNDAVVAEVLARYEAEVRQPAEDAAEAARDASDEERRQLLGQVAQLTAWKENQEAEAVARQQQRSRRWRVARRTGGFLAAALLAAGFAALVVTDQIQGKFWWATATTLLVFLCAATVSWGLEKGWKAPIGALVTVGALSTLWVNAFGVAAESKSGTRSAPPATTPAVKTGRQAR
jgi:hypothetical protein